MATRGRRPRAPCGAIGDVRAADALTAALKDKEPDVRREAAMALARLDCGKPRQRVEQELDGAVLVC